MPAVGSIKMLQKTELKTAVGYARAIRAELEQAMDDGACMHGHWDYSLDMERACLACEFGDDLSVAHVAYSRAIGQVRRERGEMLLEFLRHDLECGGSPAALWGRVELWLNAYKE